MFAPPLILFRKRLRLSSRAGKDVGSGVFDSVSGRYAGGNGSRFTYRFAANGAVEFNGIMNVMMGDCSQQVFMQKKGRASTSGNQLTIKWTGGTSTRDFSCEAANNYTKQLPAEPETKKISFKTDSTKQKLFCTGAGSDQTCYSPAK